MPTETSKDGPRADEQMSSCFLKLYTLTRVCDIYIMSCSSAQPLTSSAIQILRLLSRHCMPESLPLHGGGWGGALSL